MLQEKQKTQSCIEFFDDNNISFFSKLNLFFRSIFALDKNATPNFVWLAVSLFWVSCTRSSQDILTFQTFLWLLKWRSQVYFLQGLLSNAHSQPLQPINSRGYRSIFRTFHRKNVSLSLSSCERSEVGKGKKFYGNQSELNTFWRRRRVWKHACDKKFSWIEAIRTFTICKQGLNEK